MPQTIPLSPIPNQEITVVLGEQNCNIQTRQLGDALYMTLVCNGETVFETILCNNGSPLPPFSTTKFNGHLVFIDTIANSHPSYEQLGDRFILIYDSDD